MQNPLRLVFTGTPQSQVETTARLLASGREQGRLFKVLGESAKVLNDIHMEFKDIKAPGLVEVLDSVLLVLIIQDNEGLKELDRLIRAKTLELATDYVVITFPELATVIRASLRDCAGSSKVFSYSHAGINQVAYSTIKLIENNTIPVLHSATIVDANEAAAPQPPTAPSTPPATFAQPIFAMPEPKAIKMMSMNDGLQALMAIDGALGACVVECASGMVLAKCGGATLNLEIAAAGNTEVLRAKQKTLKALGMQDRIDDILISLGQQIHILRPTQSRPGIFLYLVLDRARANMALARMKTAEIDEALVI
jgi:hypothetical protein